MSAQILLARAMDVARARIDAVWFAEHKLGLQGDRWHLDEWQRELLNAACDVWRKKSGDATVVNHDGLNMITVRAMHGPGKTFGVAAVMHWFNYCFKGRIICTAPKQAQLQTRMWPAFRRINSHAGAEYQSETGIDVDKLHITWHGEPDWCAIAETASQPENLAGYHDDYMLIVVDEASGVDEAMYPVLEGVMSTGTFVLLILISNPTRNQGTFHDSHCKPVVAKNYYKLHVSLDKTTRVSRDWVRRMEEKYGANSPVVKVRCYGEFAATSENQLLQYDWLQAAIEREAINDGSVPRLRVTVDVADGGEDESVLTAAFLYDGGEHIIEQRVFNFPPAESPVLCADEAEALFVLHGGRKGIDDIVVDSLGVGSGTAGTLMQRGHSVVAYRGGEGSDNPALWRNRRTQSYICARDSLMRGTVSFGEKMLEQWDDFTAQACSVRTRPGSERLEELETKDAMKRRGVKSPDHADSFVMLYATQTPTLPVALEVQAGPTMESAHAAW